MVCLRAVYSEEEPDTADELPSQGGPARGVVVVHCCALQLVQYQPLVDVVAAAFRLPPGFQREDPLQLHDIQRRLQVLREAQLATRRGVQSFEQATGVRDLEGGGTFSSSWRCFAATAGVRATAVRPLTRRFFLLQHLALPAGRQTLLRQAWPPTLTFAPYFSDGLLAVAQQQQTGSVGASSECLSLEENESEGMRHSFLTDRLMQGIASIRGSIRGSLRGQAGAQAAEPGEPQRPTTPTNSPSRPRPATPITSPPRPRANNPWTLCTATDCGECRDADEIDMVDGRSTLSIAEEEVCSDVQGWLPAILSQPAGAGGGAGEEVEVELKVVKWTDLAAILEANCLDSWSEDSCSLRL